MRPSPFFKFFFNEETLLGHILTGGCAQFQNAQRPGIEQTNDFSTEHFALVTHLAFGPHHVLLRLPDVAGSVNKFLRVDGQVKPEIRQYSRV